jgi:hypothetical protein
LGKCPALSMISSIFTTVKSLRRYLVQEICEDVLCFLDDSVMVDYVFVSFDSVFLFHNHCRPLIIEQELGKHINVQSAARYLLETTSLERLTEWFGHNDDIRYYVAHVDEFLSKLDTMCEKGDVPAYAIISSDETLYRILDSCGLIVTAAYKNNDF